MLGHRDILVHLIEAQRPDRGDRVFLAVDNTLLQAGIDFLEVQRRRIGTERAEHLDKDRNVGGPHLETRKIGDLANWTVSGHVAPTPVPERIKYPDTGLRAQVLEHLFAKGSVQNALGGIPVLPQEGAVQDQEIGHQVPDRTRTHDGHLDAADANRLHDFGLAA